MVAGREVSDADSGNLPNNNLDRLQVLMTFMKWINSRNQDIMRLDWGWMSSIGGVKGSHNTHDPKPRR